MTAGGWKTVAGDEFSVAESMGGVRGLIENAAPGIVFVVTYLAWGGFRIPTIAALATVVLMVIVRLIERSPLTHAFSGVFGVVIGAIWAWRFADPGEYFVPGFYINGATLLGLVVSIAVRYPAVGIVVALARGNDMSWRRVPRLRRKFAWATAIMAAMFALKLAVQLPLYFADQIAALGVAKLAMGIPLFVVTAWAIWLMVRNEELPQAPQDQPQPKR